MSIQGDLNKILDVKKDIYNSIKNKNVEIDSDTPFDELYNRPTNLSRKSLWKCLHR